MKKRVFIGINLPNDIKKNLTRAVSKWKDLPLLLTSEENLHITVYFIGFVYEDAIVDISEKMHQAVKGTDVFNLSLDEISWGPNEKNPKHIWISGKPSEELKNLQEKIEKSFGTFRTEKKAFRPHITLARFRNKDWQVLKQSGIDKDFTSFLKVAFSVTEVSLFESVVEEGRRIYLPIDTIYLEN